MNARSAACGAAAALLALGLATATPAEAPNRSGAPSGALGLTGQDNGKPISIQADNGVEWQQSNQVYIARGNAKATRGETSVSADTLYAYYRPAPASSTANASAPEPALRGADALDTGSTQVYRIEADGHVVFATPTQTAYGDHAIYDVDQALLVLTGKNLKIVTPQDTITARDSFEWYDQKQIGVARGDAVAVRQGPTPKSIRGDILIAEVRKGDNQATHISKVDAHGNVILTSEDEVARSDAAVYNLDTGIATLTGHVSLTRGSNELRGEYGVVDTNTNVARLLSAPPTATLAGPRPRVEGLFIPRSDDTAAKAKP
ncbi:MAG TPA: LptA/OstA family protein [Stellaceae bacterium]|nr:LptA/OstA family protein [Stellaceae bacterium]